MSLVINSTSFVVFHEFLDSFIIHIGCGRVGQLGGKANTNIRRRIVPLSWRPLLSKTFGYGMLSLAYLISTMISMSLLGVRL